MLDLMALPLPAFFHIERFSGRDYDFWVAQGFDPVRALQWIFRWELGISKYHDCFISFTRPLTIAEIDKDFMTMAQPKKSLDKAQWQGFIDVTLTDADKAQIAASWEKAKYPQAIAALADVGKLTISYNAKNSQYNASVVFYSGELAGWCVSSFGNSPMLALYVTWYKLDVYGDDLQPGAAQANRPAFG